MNLLPSLIAPLEFGGGWRLDSSFARQAAVQAASAGLACFFIFFAILALQGVLLNLLPANLFARVSVYVQGALAGLFLLGGFYSWSIKEWNPETIGRLPEFGAWLPPVWFTGLHQTLSGVRDPFLRAMAGRALFAGRMCAGACPRDLLHQLSPVSQTHARSAGPPDDIQGPAMEPDPAAGPHSATRSGDGLPGENAGAQPHAPVAVAGLPGRRAGRRSEQLPDQRRTVDADERLDPGAAIPGALLAAGRAAW